MATIGIKQVTLVANRVDVFLISILNRIIASAVPKTESMTMYIKAIFEKGLLKLTLTKSVVNT